MHSPLPDSSTLEAGIIEDVPPTRISRVQDNVRNLLRSSMLGSVRSSPRTASPETSPRQPAQFAAVWPQSQPDVLPSPTESVATTVSTNSSTSTATTSSQRSNDLLLPPISYHQAARHMTHESALFNTEAVTVLNHPDLEAGASTISSHPDIRRKQRHAWKRSKRHEVHHSIAGSQRLLCVIIGIALSGLLATYIALAVTSTQAPPVFHILFILGILLVGIAFIHTVARMVFVPVHRHRRHGKSRHRHHRRVGPPAQVISGNDHFLPSTPIRVLVGTDEIRLDPEEAQPSTAVHQPPEVWDKDSVKNVTNPPPAYGRWRESVRVNPELLHWQAVPSPIEEIITIRSPTYEESSHSQSSAGSPPSYKTKESPARTRAAAEAQSAPEMVEGRGIGIAE